MPLALRIGRKRQELAYLQKWTLVSIAIGVLVGIATIIFFEAVEIAVRLLLGLTGYHPPAPGEKLPSFVAPDKLYLLPVIMFFGGLATGIIIKKLSPEVKGGGLDAAIHAFHSGKGEIRTRVPFLKIIASSFTIGAGGSAGREGPMGQIGAGIGSLVARVLKLDDKEKRIALAAGIGSGMGAIFKAPLGGALMGTEILYSRDFEKEALIPAIMSSIVGYTIFSAYDGTSPIFYSPEIEWNLIQIPFFMLLGIVLGFVGVLYVKALKLSADFFKALKLPVYLKPALGLFSVGLLAVMLVKLFPGEEAVALGGLEIGYGFIQLAIFNSLSLKIMLLLVAVKIIMTSITIGSGGSGGDFAPGLVVGAMTGGCLGKLLSTVFPELVPAEAIPAFVIIGMMALFGGASKAPISVILMVSEMTSSYSLLFPSLVAIVGSYLVTGRHTLYSAQVPTRLHSPAHLDEYFCDLLKVPRVRDAMRREFPVAKAEDTLKETILKMRHGVSALPIIEEGEVKGIVRLRNIVEVPFEKWEKVKVAQVMRHKFSTLTPDKSLFEALKFMEAQSIGTLIVVNKENPKKVEGILLKRDIVKLMEGIG